MNRSRNMRQNILKTTKPSGWLAPKMGDLSKLFVTVQRDMYISQTSCTSPASNENKVGT